MPKTFDQIAPILATKLSALLQTEVVVSNTQNSAISEHQWNGHHPLDRKNGHSKDLKSHYLKLSFHVQDQVGEVIIKQDLNNESLSAKHAQAFIDLLLSQLAAPSLLDQQFYKNQVISNLLHGRIDDEGTALQQATMLGIDFAPPRAVILIDATNFIFSPNNGKESPTHHQSQYSQIIIDSIVTFFNLPDDTICADLGGGQFAVLKASDSKNLDPWASCEIAPFEGSSAAWTNWTNLDALKRAGDALLMRLREVTQAPISVGIGRYHPGLLGLSRSYQDALAALRLGRQFNGQNRVYCLDDLGIAAFACVADERTKVELALHLLSPLDNEPELIHTLKYFFDENCALTLTAKRLCIHRNTLTYRLEKITSLTGLDPRRFDEAVQIRLALLLKEFQGICM